MNKFNDLPINAELNILKAMIRVAISDNAENIRDLISKIGIDEDQKAMFWRAILSQLSSQRKEIDSEDDILKHPLPVRETDFKNGNDIIDSLINYIQSKSDSIDENLEDEDNVLKSILYKQLEEQTKNQGDNVNEKYWNDSLQSLVKKIQELTETYLEDSNNKEIFKKITIGDLHEADAAYDFNGEPWVKPEYNIDEKTYSEIRNKDKILDILNNSNKLDKTYTKKENVEEKNSFISLIMPRYGRRVEVEDLDRNFWVIAQIVDGMSSWIMEKSPMNDMIENLIEETTQLWENVLYLWLQIALISQKKSDECLNLSDSIKIIQNEDLFRYESLPVATCKLKEDKETYDIKIAKFKFMDEEVDINTEENYNPLSEFEESYPEQDLCFISQVKFNNYRKNYYSGKQFKEIVFSFLNNIKNENFEKRKLTKYQIFERYKDDKGEDKDRELIISVDPACEVYDLKQSEEGETYKELRFTPKLLCASYHNGKFFVGYPFTATSSYLVEDNRETLYCAIRAIPQIELYRDENGEKKIKKFRIGIYDAIINVVPFYEINIPTYMSRKIGEFYASEEDGTIKDNKIYMTYKQEDVIYIPEYVYKTDQTNNFAKYTLTERDWKDINFSYYLGSCISWRERTSRITNIQNLIQEPVLLKIGNFLPEGYWDQEERIAPPVPTFCMSTLPNNLLSQMRGDFTFQNIPTLFGFPKIDSSSLPEIETITNTQSTNETNNNNVNPSLSQNVWTSAGLYQVYDDYNVDSDSINNLNNETISEHIKTPATIYQPISDIQEPTNPENNSYGDNGGLPGKLYFYYFNWENYLPEKDMPGFITDNKPKDINSTSSDFCFYLSSSKLYNKICGDNINPDFLQNIGIEAIQNYLIKVSKIKGHPHEEYYKKPVNFITFIGMVPFLNTDMIRHDVNIVCHVIKYIPSPNVLEIKDSGYKNYENVYNSWSNNIEIKNGNKVLGKIISTKFINKYDSYYDLPAFQHMLQAEDDLSDKQIYTGEENRIRGLFIKNVEDENNYCKVLTINDSKIEYKVNFDSNYIGEIQYYDFYKAAADQQLTNLINVDTNDLYQVSSAICYNLNESESTSIGAIRKTDPNGKTFLLRKNSDIYPREKDNKDTGFLSIDSSFNIQTIPFINGTLINSDDRTPMYYGGWREENILSSCLYAFSSNNSDKPKTSWISTASDIDDIGNPYNIPEWIIVTKLLYDVDSNGTRAANLKLGFEGTFGNISDFDTAYITLNGSDKRAFIDFYESLITKNNPYLSNNSQIFTSLQYGTPIFQNPIEIDTSKLDYYKCLCVLSPRDRKNEQITIQVYREGIIKYSAGDKIQSYSSNIARTVSYENGALKFIAGDTSNDNAALYMKLPNQHNYDDIPDYCYLVLDGDTIEASSETSTLKYRTSYHYKKGDSRSTSEALYQLYKRGISALDMSDKKINVVKVHFSDTCVKEDFTSNNLAFSLWHSEQIGLDEGIPVVMGEKNELAGKAIRYNGFKKLVEFIDTSNPNFYYIDTSETYEMDINGSGQTRHLIYRLSLTDTNYQGNAYDAIYNYGITNKEKISEIFEEREDDGKTVVKNIMKEIYNNLDDISDKTMPYIVDIKNIQFDEKYWFYTNRPKKYIHYTAPIYSESGRTIYPGNRYYIGSSSNSWADDKYFTKWQVEDILRFHPELEEAYNSVLQPGEYLADISGQEYLDRLTAAGINLYALIGEKSGLNPNNF